MPDGLLEGLSCRFRRVAADSAADFTIILRAGRMCGAPSLRGPIPGTAMADDDPSDDDPFTRLLKQASSDPASAQRLLSTAFKELRAIAARQLRGERKD